jgi:hypothetical protein
MIAGCDSTIEGEISSEYGNDNDDTLFISHHTWAVGCPCLLDVFFVDPILHLTKEDLYSKLDYVAEFSLFIAMITSINNYHYHVEIEYDPIDAFMSYPAFCNIRRHPNGVLGWLTNE